ncbi:hypothetical protein KRP22_012685 [Phytophthora ramorum]|nr:Protein SEEDLING PLASTID DEVELOPMENT 1 [Phytophthora ramorum]
MAKASVQYIASKKKLDALLAAHGSNPVATSAKVVAVHFQFAQEDSAKSDQDRVVAVAIGNDSPPSVAVVLQLDALGASQVATGLKHLLEDPSIVKVLFDGERVARWLHRYQATNVTPVKCVDLQLLYQRVVNSSATTVTLEEVITQLGSKTTVAMAEEVAKFNAELKPQAWAKSPLAPHMQHSLTKSMRLYTRCYNGACGIPGMISNFPTIHTLTSERWRNSFADPNSLNSTNKATQSRSPGFNPELDREMNPNSPVHTPPSAQRVAASSLRVIKYITSDVALQKLLKHNNNMLVQGPVTTVGVHFQFTREKSRQPVQCDDDQLVAISVVGADASDTAVVLQLDSLSQAHVLPALKMLLSDPATVKVMHNVHRAAFYLHHNGLTDVELANCTDLQIVYENAINTSELQASMFQIVKHCESTDTSSSIAQTTQSFKAKVKRVDPAEWARTPLPESLLKTLANEAQLYAQCYRDLEKVYTDTAKWGGLTKMRWRYATENQGHQAIWFDPDADNQPRSLEYFSSYNDRTSNSVRLPDGILPLELQCELASLLELLPTEYRDTIMNIADYRTKLVDVCLDVGRIPHVYTGKKQRVVLSKNNEVVSKDTIDEIVTNLGGEMRIGDDNRAGIDRQLHRISVMRSKTDEVYGLTMRVGRALLNAACVLTDLLLSERHADKSVLVLGHPGSGKTTLIRDVARCVSETMENVCIIDTSNEIGGDGLVPHACVGWARRMMVRSLEAQAGVMVECVQNHTVETLIVDEIGRKAEVLAASTVRQRGPRLIASAHGDFRALIKNPDLKGLVGGSQQVIVGDGAAAKSANKSKLQTQRAGNPIFDVIVELDHVVRGRCRIIWDVAKAVDSVLEGGDYTFETRQWDSSTLGIHVLDV